MDFLENDLRLKRLVESKCDLGPDALTQLTVDFSGRARKYTLKALQDANVSLLMAKVLAVADWRDEMPAVLVCCDHASSFFALVLRDVQLSDIAQNAVLLQSILAVRDPELCANRDVPYPCVQVADVTTVSIMGGGPLCPTNPAGYVAADQPPVAVCPVAASAPSEIAEPRGALALGCWKDLPADHSDMPLEKKSKVIAAMLQGLDKIMEQQVGSNASSRIGRVKKMFEHCGRGEVFDQDSPELGRIYSTGFMEGLGPAIPFLDPTELPWCANLKKHWAEIRDELLTAQSSNLWSPAHNKDATAKYAVENAQGEAWRISKVMYEGNWSNDHLWPRTRAIIESLEGVNLVEAFFARMPPHSTLAAHTDWLNYQLSLHLTLSCEEGACAFKVGNQEENWKEGEILIANTSYVHSCRNDSDQSRLVLIFRFWHPGLTPEELVAIKWALYILEQASSGSHPKSESKPLSF